MTVPESNKLLTTVAITPTATSTKVHSFVRQSPVTLASFQASQEESGRGEHNGRVSVQPTSFEGGLLVGLYDPHLGPQCAEYLQQHLVPILDESLSTQLDHSDDDHSHAHSPHQNNPDYRIDPNQVIDTLKSTFRELDELLVATAITVALTQPDVTDLASADELRKTQEVLAQVVTGSTALVGFLAPHHPASPATTTTTTTTKDEAVVKHDLYLAQLGDSVAILAGLDATGTWSARRLNPPETEEHSVRYKGSDEYRKVVVEAKERALTAEQFLTMGNGSLPSSQQGWQHQQQQEEEQGYESFLTRGGKFLGLPVTRSFGFLDWKIEQEPRTSVATWVEKGLRARIEQTLHSGLEGTIASQEESGICNLDDPPYIVTDPKIARFVIETSSKGPSSLAVGGRAVREGAGSKSDEVIVLLNRGFLYAPRSSDITTNNNNDNNETQNPYDQPLISDFELSRIVAQALEREENAAQALAKALDQSRKERVATLGAQQQVVDYFEGEGSILVIAL
ncbi:hypothetical protein BGZ59_007615 [Podila verticillata]|uniref:PPM-type phosphatase domain-containing protein n=1 Tax=Podila verticillata NRRL 6337 TaxID=1069443 RepID=A0A086TJN3_9FUNG|nr:hypothetical protein BGZ59_007615 [Podila verticillata]KFH62160.1 hypothetical protein MVEG_11799 [Podila verticillata NRRL 6337]